LRFSPDLVQGDAKTLEHACGNTLTLTHQTNEQMLSANVVMTHATRFVYGKLNDALGPGGQADVLAGHRLFAPADDELYR
jgi:hypothetical protein